MYDFEREISDVPCKEEPYVSNVLTLQKKHTTYVIFCIVFLLIY